MRDKRARGQIGGTARAPVSTLAVVWLSAQYAEGPIHLFEQHDASQLVRQRHLAEGEAFVGARKDVRSETSGASDEEDDRAVPVEALFAQPLRECFRGKLPPA